MLKGNKGEWSELYVLVSLLATGKLYQSDIYLNKDLDNVYEVIKAFRSEEEYDLAFELGNQINLFKIIEGATELITSFTIKELQEVTQIVLTGTKEGKGRSFSIVEANSFLEKASIKKLKADPSSKADIKLRIYDHRLAKETDLGFSIKSLLGNDSTLLNTGAGNNFIYEIENNLNSTVSEFNKRTYKPEGGISKLTYRLKEIEKQNCNISFDKVQSSQLWRNLKMIDGDLPEILSYALYYRWIYREKSLLEVANILEEKDPLNFYGGEKLEQRFYEYKIKRLLTECAMGMTSETPWSGEYDLFGGVIIVKNDGNLVCFHIYDFNLFREYLINNTMFEQAATSEDGDNPGHEKPKPKKKYFYGWLYEDMDKLFFKINLQIRFK